MAWDRLRRTGRNGKTQVAFYTALHQMFGVQKYSDALEKLRLARGVDAHFRHNLVQVDAANRTAVFQDMAEGGTRVSVSYDMLHVTPPMGPLAVVRDSPLADDQGWVAVDPATCRSTRFGNVWSLGDCSSLPTSKTAAAVIAEAPVLTENLFQVMDTGRLGTATYDGYTSCPVRLPFFNFHLKQVI